MSAKSRDISGAPLMASLGRVCTRVTEVQPIPLLGEKGVAFGSGLRRGNPRPYETIFDRRARGEQPRPSCEGWGSVRLSGAERRGQDDDPAAPFRVASSDERAG